MTYQCKTKKHTWLDQDSAQKCCNGYKRIFVPVQQGQLFKDPNVTFNVDLGWHTFAWMEDEDLFPKIERQLKEISKKYELQWPNDIVFNDTAKVMDISVDVVMCAFAASFNRIDSPKDYPHFQELDFG